MGLPTVSTRSQSIGCVFIVEHLHLSCICHYPSISDATTSLVVLLRPSPPTGGPFLSTGLMVTCHCEARSPWTRSTVSQTALKVGTQCRFSRHCRSQVFQKLLLSKNSSNPRNTVLGGSALPTAKQMKVFVPNPTIY